MMPSDSSTPKVLILLAVYNGMPWLPDQLQSLVNQEGVEVTILIHDDASTDTSRRYLNEACKGKSNIEVHYRQQGTGSAGQNFFSLIREAVVADHHYVAFADQDDIWLPTKLLAATRCMQSSQAGLYSCSTRAFWTSGRQKVLKQSTRQTSSDYLFEGAGQGCTFVLEAAFFRKLQTFCIANRHLTSRFYYHDWCVYLIARCWSVHWAYEDIPHINYRQHSGNDTGSRGTIAASKRRIELLKTGWYRGQIDLAAQIALKASPRTERLVSFSKMFSADDSIARRYELFRYCLHSGRRHLGDRLITMFAAAVGWI